MLWTLLIDASGRSEERAWCGCAGPGVPHGERSRRSRTSGAMVINPVVDVGDDVQQPRITGPAVQRRHGGDDIEPTGSVPSSSSTCPFNRLRRGQMLWSCWTMLNRANRRNPPLARCRQARTA